MAARCFREKEPYHFKNKNEEINENEDNKNKNEEIFKKKGKKR